MGYRRGGENWYSDHEIPRRAGPQKERNLVLLFGNSIVLSTVQGPGVLYLGETDTALFRDGEILGGLSNMPKVTLLITSRAQT